MNEPNIHDNNKKGADVLPGIVLLQPGVLAIGMTLLAFFMY